MTDRGGTRAAAAALAAIAFAGACSGATAPARDQWKVVLGTDAPIPQLGEQLLVELLDDAGHLTSSRVQRLIDASNPAIWPISFGLVPDTPAIRPRIRVRLYRLEDTGSDGLPAGDTLIDATATLPPANGLTEVGLTLSSSCFSVAVDPASHRTCDPAKGSLAPEPTLAPGLDPKHLSAPGSWPPAASRPCADPAPKDMVCIPGGLFLLGSPHFVPLDANSEPLPQHLVQLHAFAIDVAEVTVGQVRQLVRSGGLPPPLTQGVGANCTYAGADNTANDADPANCLPWTTADQACRLLGKRLPTEAEWEYVARNLAEESPFPWGADTAICNYAIVARSVDTSGGPRQCRVMSTPTLPSGPAAVGSKYDMSAHDKTKLGVENLGGNLSEWVADFFAPYSGPCWTGRVLRVDPRCDDPSSQKRSVRGGSWEDVEALAGSALRTGAAERDLGPSTGFRCALSR